MNNVFRGRSLLLAAAVLAVVGISGCRTEYTSAGAMMESYPGNKVTVNSRLFGGWFTVVGSTVARGDNGLLKVTITVANRKKNDAQMEYRYRWVDKDGIEITSGSSIWTAKSAGGGEHVLLSGIAPTKIAEDFILDLRFVQKSHRYH